MKKADMFLFKSGLTIQEVCYKYGGGNEGGGSSGDDNGGTSDRPTPDRPDEGGNG